MMNNKATDLFNSIINTLALREIHISGGKYTWTKYQTHPTLEKLDRILMSECWEDIFPLVSVRKLVREISDHNPLLLSSGEEGREAPKPREFRFNLSWINDDKFLPTVRRIWARNVASSDPIDVLNIKLKRFKIYFKGWGSDKYGHDKKRKEDLRMELAMLEELEEEDMLPPDLYSRKMDINAELYELLVNEEFFWLQQSHERWLLKGDLNTDYYHKIANGRKRKNTIHSFTAGEVTIEGTQNLLNHATTFYKDLFWPARGNLFHLSSDTWSEDEKFNEEDDLLLTSEFTD